MMEMQKHSKTPTKDAIRLAEMMQQGRELGNTSDDVASQKRIKKVIELTNCTPSVAEVALIDCEGSVEEAVAQILDKPEELVLWSQQAGKTRKSKSLTVPTSNASNNKTFVTHGRRVESQRGSRFRNDVGGEQQQPQGEGKQGGYNNFQGRQKRALSNKDQNGHPDRTKVYEQKNRNRVRNVNINEKSESTAATTTNNGGWGQNQNGWGDQREETGGMGTFTSDTVVSRKNENKEDEWKSGPRVFMPSTVNTNSANMVVNTSLPVNATSSWPSLDNNPAAPTTTMADLPQPIPENKPKTFASVAATKKAPPAPPLQPPVKAQSSSMTVNELVGSSTAENKQATQIAVPDMAKSSGGDAGVTEWSSAVDWGTTLSPPLAEPSPARQSVEQQPASEVFGSSAHAMNVNQKYTDELKSVIGLGGSTVKSPNNQGAVPASNPVPVNSMDTFQQQISQLSKHSMATSAAGDTTELGKKVEFATGDFPPPVADASAYQFGFHFNKDGIPSAASFNDAWSNKPHISTVELDRSMLKDATVNVLSTMTNIPTTSSNVTAHAHFSTTAQQQQQAQSHDFQRNTTSRGAALSFTDTASVNYPPANSASGMLMSGGAQTNIPPPQQSGIPSTAQQQQPQQQQGKPVYTASNQSMVLSAQQQQHLQHIQQQSLYHQTSAAAATAVPQFPNYNMQYMYSPVATAQAIPGQNAEIDRFFMQQQYAPYTGLDVQLSAMSLGPPTTLAPTHRNPMETFMENKFAPNQQQQSVNQGNAAVLQHNQSNQQHRGPPQNETNAMFGGSGVAPPPGFGMPTAAAQPSFMPQATNLQSLFQMPQYHPQMSYQHQFMMPNAANRMPSSQRPAQTSPPEGNGHQQRRHDNRGPDSQSYGGGGGPDSVDHSNGGAAAANQSYMNKFNYRQYM